MKSIKEGWRNKDKIQVYKISKLLYVKDSSLNTSQITKPKELQKTEKERIIRNREVGKYIYIYIYIKQNDSKCVANIEARSFEKKD